MKHISSIASGFALGTAGILMMGVLSGCESKKEEPQNRFLVIEQQTNGKYVVIEETPTEGPSRAIIREKDAQGNVTERFMSEAEMKALAEQEYQKVQSGTSETVQSGDSSAGMGLAGTILAVAAGSLLGNMIGNALMNNKNFAQRSNTVNKSAYSRSAAASKASSGSSSKKSFFGSSSGSSTSKSTNYGS
jgi:hypothetical protein